MLYQNSNDISAEKGAGFLNLGPLSYGTVEGAGRPEGYLTKPVETVIKPFHSDDYGDDVLLFSTIPPQLVSAKPADHPDGWTECILRGYTKRTILSTPGFPQPLVQPPQSCYCIGPSHNGLGMFATCDLSIGDLIVAERPLMVTPRGLSLSSSISLPVNFTAEQRRQAAIFEWEKTLQTSFDRMEPENQAAFMALANNHLEDGSGPLLGIIRTNGFEVEGLHDPMPDGEYTGVCKIISRINHSCSPSADRLFDIPSFSFQLRAARDIKSGQEIFVSYSELLQPYSKRQKHLAPYGIKCVCASCSHNTTESDKCRIGIRNSIDSITLDFENWLADPLLADDHVIRISLGWLFVIKEEGLEASDPYKFHTHAIVKAYQALGDVENAIKYGRMYGLWSLAQTGKIILLRKMEDPEYHRSRPTWAVRVYAEEIQ